MKISREQRQKINEIGRKHNLRYVLIYGSYARGQEKKGSDLDVAVYGKDAKETRENYLKIFADIESVFGNNRERELDVKLLHNTNPLFRREVTRDGILIYGEKQDYILYKMYAFRDFCDSSDLFRLQNAIIKKRMENLRFYMPSKKYA